MKSLLNFFSILLILGFTSCVPDEPDPTQLEITVLSNTGAPVSGAKISLYTTESDLIGGSNAVSIQYSDGAGKALFTNLFPVRYFWFIEKGCSDNSNSTYGTAASIPENQTSTTNVIINPKPNTLYVSSYVSGDYYCYVNGTYQGIITSYGGMWIENLPDGSYYVELLEVDYILFQNTYTSTVDLSCGAYFTLNYGLNKSATIQVVPSERSPFEYLKEGAGSEIPE